MGRYTINYHTGAGDDTINGTLDDAMQAADEGAAYTQQPITICDEDGNAIAQRVWWGTKYDAEEAGEGNPICFGDYGYYGDWESL